MCYRASLATAGPSSKQTALQDIALSLASRAAAYRFKLDRENSGLLTNPEMLLQCERIVNEDITPENECGIHTTRHPS
jgi:hypothetical protein